ncbi:MAG: DUF3108 domain-containing protein [Acidobacteria bacterium]|nr:DUF3108 domain-containing protein [Acidobacteriota bacterium]
MKQSRKVWMVTVGWVILLGASSGDPVARAAPSFSPLTSGERLTYRLLWPSGLNLGEAILEASPSATETHFQMTVEISLPQYVLRHSSSSVAAGEGLCSLQFREDVDDGTKKWWEETIEFDQVAHEAHRTRNGQTTTDSIPECAQDPITFLYYFRSRLAEGKPSDSGTLYRGGSFTVRVRAAGSETVPFRGQQRPTEKFVVTYPSQNQEMTFELWLSTDAERLPLRMRVPSPLAVFTAELQ